MKKARVILTALTVFAVVGGALAFKAQKSFQGNLQCTFEAGQACIEPAFQTIQSQGQAAFCTELGASGEECPIETHAVLNP